MIREQWRLTSGPEWTDIETPSGLIVADGVQRGIAEHIVSIHNAALAARPDRDGAALEASILAIKTRVDFARNTVISDLDRERALTEVSQALGSLRAALAAQDRTGGSDGG